MASTFDLNENHQKPEELLARLNNLCAEGRYQEAINLACSARDLILRQWGQDHPILAQCLLNLAAVYQRIDDCSTAESLILRALGILRHSMGTGHPDYASGLEALASVYRALEERFAALPLYRQALEIRRQSQGEDHPDNVACLDNLARLYREMGDSAAALPLLLRSLEIRRTVHGEEHPDYAASLDEVAGLYQGMGNYKAALPLSRESLELTRTKLGEDHPLFATRLDRLAFLHGALGNYSVALSFYRQALDIRREAFGEDHPDYATSLDNLAGIYQAMGNQAAALPLCRRAMKRRRATLGESHPDYARSLRSLARLRRATGNYAAALALLHQSLAINRTAPSEDDPDFATSLDDLAGLHAEMGDYQAALPYACQALDLRHITLGDDHPDYATSLSSLAGLYLAMGDDEAALPLCRRALNIRGTMLGKRHPSYASSLDNLAGTYQAMGRLDDALPLCQESLEIRRAVLGEGHPDYATGLDRLAVVLAGLGTAAEAASLLERSAAIRDRMIGQVFAIGSDRQKIGYLNIVLNHFYTFLSLVQQHLTGSHSAVCAALDLVIRRKAIAAEALATQRDAVLGGKYPDLEPKLRELAALRWRLARKKHKGYVLRGSQPEAATLVYWNAKKERLEADLARHIPEMNLEHQLRAADRRAVALSLPEGSALVEFVRFPVLDFLAVPTRGDLRWKPARYVAFIMPNSFPDDVRMIDLGEAEPIDRLIADFRAGIISEAETEDGRDMAKGCEGAPPIAEDDSGPILRGILFDRLAPALGSRTRLVIAPDGDLTRLPFEILPAVDGRLLIDDYQVSYLTCGRDVLRFNSPTTAQPGAPLVVADPDFDLPARDLLSQGGYWDLERSVPSGVAFVPYVLGSGRRVPSTSKPPLSTAATEVVSARRHSRDLDHGPSAYRFDRLLGSRAEGERISTLLNVVPWLGDTALESRIKAACRSPRILHLATHGFFLPDQRRDLNREGWGLSPESRAFYRGPGLEFGAFGGPEHRAGPLWGPMRENPMLRSGLALAGANTWLRYGDSPEEAEDGLLTAEDVTGLDLVATELVVLSACETGLGEIHVSEGVFGLRRAFVLAGARTLVMSLWKVPDEPTRELMEDFYVRLLAGEGRAEALRGAQLAMKARYPDPYYWGAFICQGDPSPLAKFDSREVRTDVSAG